MDEIESEIKKINLKIDEIELKLKKSFKFWTEEEKEEFGNHELLRIEEKQLMKEKEQLRELLILKEKEKQGTVGIVSYLGKVSLASKSEIASENTSKCEYF